MSAGAIESFAKVAGALAVLASFKIGGGRAKRVRQRFARTTAVARRTRELDDRASSPRPNFKRESTFSTWLYRIATNASLMKLRRRREGHVSYEQSQGNDADAEPLAFPDWSTQPLEELLDSEAREVLGREVDQLPANEKEVFVLRDIMEQSNSDVAQELGLTIAAVKSRLHRARLHLRDRMNRYFRDRASRPPG